MATRRAAVFLCCLGMGISIVHVEAENTTTNATRRVGFYYTNDIKPDIPMSVHVLKVDRSHSELFLTTTLGQGSVMGMETVVDQIQALPPELGRPIAAINGDYYDKTPNYPGRPRNIQVHHGEVVSSPSGNCAMWTDSSGDLHMTNVFSRFEVIWPNGKTNVYGLNQPRTNNCIVLYTAAMGASTHTSGGVELILGPQTNSAWLPLKVGGRYQACVKSVNTAGDSPLLDNEMVLSIGPDLLASIGTNHVGDILRITTDTTPDMTGAIMAIGGGPSLVEKGQVMTWKGLIVLRHPRTAVGWNKDYLYLVEVDGRQADVSVGMTLEELAHYMLRLGCESAMNLDGGGSSTFWYMGHVLNSPSEGRERPAPNALVLMRKKP